MTNLGWFLFGFFALPAIAAGGILLLTGRDAWERHRAARRQRPPKELLERWQRADALTLTDEDAAHLAEWERELKSGADA